MRKGQQKFISLLLVLMCFLSCINTGTVFARAGTVTDTSLNNSENTSIVGSADIVFVIDSTGSMDKYITSVKENLTNFVNLLNQKSVMLNMSIVEYRDIEKDGVGSTIYHDFNGSNWTSDVNEVIKVFDSIKVDGGGDIPETPIDAFEKITFPEDNANKFIFLLTDADFKDYEDTEYNYNNKHYSMSSWTQFFRENNIKVTVVSQNQYENNYNYLYTMTGGRFIDISSNNYYELMQEYSKWIYENAIDSDGDGLPDEWEINGVDIDRDGIIDLDLAAMGADPNVPDIFVEADWMEYAGDDFNFLGIHKKRNQKSTAPTALALRKVYHQFNSHGIKIHIDAGPNSIMNYDTGETWGDLSGASALSYQEIFDLGDNYKNWNRIAMDNFTKARWTTFRYCLFANKYDSGDGEIRRSGIAENSPGQFFIVASDCIGGSDHDTALAGTIMHELGHTLGLSHGGLHYDSTTKGVINDHNHYKCNHLSIMNYTYQFSGLRTVLGDYICNYQDFDLPEIDEFHVNEARGIDPEGVTEGKGLTIKIPIKNRFLLWDFDGEKDSGIARQAIDFNRNGTIESDIQCHLDKEFDQKTEKLGTLHETLNEWSNLKFKGGLIGGSGEKVNFDKITTLIEKSNFNSELEEIPINEAFDKGLLGDPGDCQFNSMDSITLYSELIDQKLVVDISNMYPEQTTVKIKISSDVLSSDYSDSLIVGKDGAKIEIPICDNLAIGTYDVIYTMTLKNGKVITESGKINVVAPDNITMSVGDTEYIPTDITVSCYSSDNSIVKIADNRILAKSKGTAYVTIVFDNNETYCAKITVLTSAKPNNGEKTTAELKNLETENFTLTPAFVATVRDYTSTVDYSVSKVSLTPTLEKGTKATISVNGSKAVAFDGKQAIDLKVGKNKIEIVVSGKNLTNNIYTIIVTRSKAKEIKAQNTNSNKTNYTDKSPKTGNYIAKMSLVTAFVLVSLGIILFTHLRFKAKRKKNL